MFRNRIINGDMRVAQRGTTPFGSTGYNLDRWQMVANANPKFSIAQCNLPTPLAGFSKCMRINSTTNYTVVNGDYSVIMQHIEGTNMVDLNWGNSQALTMNASFYVYANTQDTYCVTVRNYTGTRGYLAPFTITTPNTWQRVSVTIPGCVDGAWLTDSNTGIQFGISLAPDVGVANAWFNAGSVATSSTSNFWRSANNVLYITGVQFEQGTAASQFEYRPYATELQLCQRYFVRYGFPENSTMYAKLPGSGVYTNTTSGTFLLNYPTAARTVATSVAMSTTATSATNIVLSSGTGFSWQPHNSSGNGIQGISLGTYDTASLYNCSFTIAINAGGTANAGFFIQKAGNNNAYVDLNFEL